MRLLVAGGIWDVSRSAGGLAFARFRNASKRATFTEKHTQFSHLSLVFMRVSSGNQRGRKWGRESFYNPTHYNSCFAATAFYFFAVSFLTFCFGTLAGCELVAVAGGPDSVIASLCV